MRKRPERIFQHYSDTDFIRQGFMELSSEQYIAQTQDKVWEALNDPEVLKACITGCESIEKVSDNEYKVAVFAAVGPLKARFLGKLIMSDVVPPQSYALNFEGTGGVAGFGKGNANIKLSPEGEGTRLTYVVKVTVGGKLAQIGSRLIDGVGKKMSEEFFAAFNARIGNPAVAAGADAIDAATAAESVASASAPAKAVVRTTHAKSAAAGTVGASGNPSQMLPWLLFVAAVVIGVVAYVTK
jgi:hypothetical protein